MRKPKTLKGRARAAAFAVWPTLHERDGIRVKGEKLWLAGHRANRISAAHRRVVEAAKKVLVHRQDDGSYILLTVHVEALDKALQALQRAKEGANG